MKRIPFLKPGSYVDRKGAHVEITKDMLDTIIDATKSFAYQDNNFPLVIGHPETNAPAYGWINKDSVVNDNNVLIALAEDDNLVPEFKTWFGKKLYKNVSVKLRPDFSIAHIGFLGAAAPAVTGLPAVALASGDGGLDLEFAEYKLNEYYFTTLQRLFRGLKNFIISNKDIDTADKFMSEYDLSEIATPPYIRDVSAEHSNAFNENDNNNLNLSEEEMTKIEELEAKVIELTAVISAKDIDIAALKTDLSERDKKEAAAKIAAKRAEFLAFCESDEVKNKIKDGDKTRIVETLVALDAMSGVEFMEGEEKKTIATVDEYKSLLKSLPDVVEFGEHATHKTAAGSEEPSNEFSEGNIDQDRLTLHNKAKAIAKAEKISYAEALKKVK